MNISRVLTAIGTTSNVNSQVNMLTGLTAVLPFKALRDEIITSNIIYMAAHNVLSQGMADSSVRVLTLLTALLRADAGTAGTPCSRARALSARDQIRRSGCLQDMANMFLGTMMMYEETWKSLCECLIESCKGCEKNQSHCSTLIPTCIQRCEVRNSEVLKVLHTLLLNHTRNVDVFVECNGISIFTRETIQDSSKMELLSIVVKNSVAASLIMRDKDLIKCLFTIGENGQDSLKMVEWASVILFYIASHVEGNVKRKDAGDKMSEKRNTKITLESTKSLSSDFSVSFLCKPNWDIAKTTNMFKNTDTRNKIFESTLQNSTSAIRRLNCAGGPDDRTSFRSSVFENNFFPNFVSTPKKQPRKATELNGVTTSVAKQKLSMSARLFNIVNNSCVSMYQMFGNFIFQKGKQTTSQRVPLILNSNNYVEDSCYGFSENWKRQVVHTAIKNGDMLRRYQVKRKLGIKQKYRKTIMKKLKTGIHFYGCNFKKISRVMWPQEKQMTPQVLYGIYRKCIIK